MAYLKTSIYADWTMEATEHQTRQAIGNLPVITRFSTEDNVHLDVVIEGKKGVLKHIKNNLIDAFGDQLDFDTF